MAEERVLDVNGVRTHVEIRGDGPPVLFLHGASTLEGFDFADGLADRFRVYLPSHPGMGRSGDAPHFAGMSDMVVHYLNLLDALKLDRKPHLMGFSMGGWMAAELATVAREEFARIVFVAPAGLHHPDFPMPKLDEIPPQEFPGYLTHDVNVALRYFPNPADERASQEFGAARGREAEQVGRIVQPLGFGHPNLARWLPRITNQALVVWGDKDRLVPVQCSELWMKALPNATLHVEPNVGHLIFQEAPQVLRTVGDFLAR